MYDVIIIGAGIGGLTSAIYAGSRGKKVLVIEKYKPGGVLGNVSSVTHYPGVIKNETGKTIISRILDQLKIYDINLVIEEVLDFKVDKDIKNIKTNKGNYLSKNVILANGTSPKKLQANLENFSGDIHYNVIDNVDRYKNKEVFVVGGSDGAIKEALYLADITKKVSVIHHSDKLGTINEFKEKLAKKNNIELIFHNEIKKIVGNKDEFTIFLKDIHSNDIKELNEKESGIFVYIGSLPNTSIYKSLDLENDFIVTDEKMRTNIPGVYAVGDIRNKSVRQAATAASDGVIAGIEASL